MVADAAGSPQLAVETKWLSSARNLVEQCIQDLVRLELLANSYGTECMFLLAGMRRSLKSFVESKKFLAHPEHPNSKTLLPNLEGSESASLWLDTNVMYRRALLMRALSDFKGVDIPRAVVLHRVGPYPASGTLDSYTAIGWRVTRRVSGGFRPEDTFEFQLKPERPSNA